MTAPTCRTCRHRLPGEPLRCGHPTEPAEARVLEWQERTGWRAFWCGRHEADGQAGLPADGILRHSPGTLRHLVGRDVAKA